MAGKTNLSSTLFSSKKLSGKSNTGVHRLSEHNEPIPSSVQVAASTIFAEDVPQSPSQTLYLTQSAKVGHSHPDTGYTVEFVEFVVSPITGTTYDANSFDGDASAQAAGVHAYKLVMTGNYEDLTSNPNSGSFPYKNDVTLHETLGALQLVSPAFSNDIPSPYNLQIYSGSRDVEDQIPLLDEIDWTIDYSSGILFVQDYDADKIPTRAKAFIYIGKYLSASLGELSAGGGGGGGGTGTGVGWIGSAAGSISTTGSLLIGTNNTSGADIRLGNLGSAEFNANNLDQDFTVNSQNKDNAFMVDASKDQVLILSGGSATSQNESSGEDVSFYVSGSTMSQGSSQGGTSLFGGDVVTSGSLTAILGLSGSLTQLADGTSYLVAGDNVTISSSSNGQVTISSSGGGGSGTGVGWTGPGAGEIATTGSVDIGGDLNVAEYIYHKDDTNTFIRFMNDQIRINAGARQMIRLQEGTNDQVLIMSGGGGTSANPVGFADTNFFVSGAIDSRGTSVGGTSVFGGDVAVSGTLAVNVSDSAVGSQFVVTTDGKVGIGTSTPAVKLSVGGNMEVGEFINHKNDSDTFIRYQTDNISINAGGVNMLDLKEDGDSTQVLILSGGGATSANPANFTDTSFFVSGAIGGKGTFGTSVFGGDVVASGTFYGTTVNSAEISGSLTSLSDGSSYLVAGSNITITSSSNGQVTISSTVTGGGGSSFFTSPSNNNMNATGSVSLAGTLGSSHVASDKGTDVFFFVSGSSSSGERKDVTLFGGDVVISGTLQGGSPLKIDGGVEVTGTFELKPKVGDVAIVRNPDGPVKVFANTNLKLGAGSGTIDLLDLDDGAAGAFHLSGSGPGAERSVSLNTPGTLFLTGAAGGVVISGALQVGSIVPETDSQFDLGSPTKRFANIYTGDLHLRNERGHWQIVEERDFLTVINRHTGKKYKMVLELID